MNPKPIEQVLANLEPEERQALELALFSGLTAEEIAARTGQPIERVRPRLRLALSRLRAVLEG